MGPSGGPGPRDDVATTGGPRLGLIVSKAVGNAVTRHRVARRLRAAFREVAALIPAETLVVVRARPSADGPSSVALAGQLRTALEHRRVRAQLAESQLAESQPAGPGTAGRATETVAP